LYSEFGCGDVGPGAREFVGLLAEAGVRWWQMLPTHPVGDAPSFSPYNGTSAFALAGLLVSVEDLGAEGWLTKGEVRGARVRPGWRVDYPAVVRVREELLRKAYARFASDGGETSRSFARFVAEEKGWLEDWAVFAAARQGRGVRGRKVIPWVKFERGLSRHDAGAVAMFAEKNAAEVGYQRFVQYVLAGQWARLRKVAAEAGVWLLGDVPIFVSHDSADVWARRELWELDGSGKATGVSGCPPDGFAPKGQLWGHPQYRWRVHGKDDYAWWVSRFGRMLKLFDGVRIDHFLGFNRVWSIPCGAKDARGGKWVKTPGREIFGEVTARLGGEGRIVAEDLGAVVAEATALRESFGFPGMRVLQFGFGGGDEHLPWGYVRNCVAYTGTHDNDTSLGWWKGAPRDEVRKARSMGIGSSAREVSWEMVRAVMGSVANTAVVPVQDVLGLGGEHRMNVPGTALGNWAWRLGERVPAGVVRRFRELVEATGRQGAGNRR
jgi:4-alpha-glucanotransferase